MNEFHTQVAHRQHHRATPDLPPPTPDQPHPCPPGLRDTTAQQRAKILRVACPHCHARPGQRCVVTSTGRELADSHPARVEHAAAQAAQAAHGDATPPAYATAGTEPRETP